MLCCKTILYLHFLFIYQVNQTIYKLKEDHLLLLITLGKITTYLVLMMTGGCVSIVASTNFNVQLHFFSFYMFYDRIRSSKLTDDYINVKRERNFYSQTNSQIIFIAFPGINVQPCRLHLVVRRNFLLELSDEE